MTALLVVSNDDLAVILMADAGLRSGEVSGLRWCDIWWGRSKGDTSRHLHICNNNPAGGGRNEAPESGRTRRVQLSQRLRARLREGWLELGQPEIGYVAPGFDASNFAKRFSGLCRKAGIGSFRPKDLRSTYASHLLSLGTPLTYIAAQLGHTSSETTRRHYARYIPAGYLAPLPSRTAKSRLTCLLDSMR